MHSLALLPLSLLLPTLASASGYTTYKQLIEGADNNDQITYYAPVRSTTVFVYAQILPDGSDHSALYNDFQTFASNYAAHNISLIPRLRYGTSDGNISVEPDDADIIAQDVTAWAGVLNATLAAGATIQIVQAGLLGQWGEWHDGPFCEVAGTGSSAASMAVKKNVVDTLMGTGIKVAIRTPLDHSAIMGGQKSAQVTIHDDCIFAEGPGGPDDGTFVDGDGQTADYWRNYTIEVAAGNGYGGEGCETTYDWRDYEQLCGGNGLVQYINEFQIAYLNPGNPEAMETLFNSDTINTTCVAAIQEALESHSM